jgi:dihydroorotate dehydrogenase
MIRCIFWKICRYLYVGIAKPLLFLISPDKIHDITIRFCIAVRRIVPLGWFVRLIFTARHDERLIQDYHGVKFNSPVGLAAGFDKNGEAMTAIATLGFGFETVGSVTAKRCTGNPRPWFYRLPKTGSLVVNAGLNNDGSSVVIERIREYCSQSVQDFPIILSVAKTNNRKAVDTEAGIADYITTIKRVKNEQFVQMVELNISCPNTHGGEPFTTPKRLERLLTAVDAVNIKQPVYVKMPVDMPWNAFKGLLDVIIKHDVSGVTIANLAKDRTKIELKDNLPDTVHGNLSGKPTLQPSNELIRQTYINYGDKLTIIGVGGIFSAEDAYTKIRLGASLVEIITGMIFRGPQLVAEINYDLSRYLERDGYTHISQAIGIDANIEVPSLK